MKWRSFEEALPEGYVSRLTVDCQDKKLGILMNLAALAIMAVLCVVFWRLIQPWDAFLAAPLTSLLKTAVFFCCSPGRPGNYASENGLPFCLPAVIMVAGKGKKK